MIENDTPENLSDNESYFLTPVNEYNIVDKIQLANNLLFTAIKKDEITTEESNDQLNDARSKLDTLKLQSKHRVTFSSDIEEFEEDDDTSTVIDENDIDTPKNCNNVGDDNDDNEINKEITEIIEREEKRQRPEMEPSTKIDGVLQSVEDEYSSDGISLDANDYATELDTADEIKEEIRFDGNMDVPNVLHDDPKVDIYMKSDIVHDVDVDQLEQNQDKCFEPKSNFESNEQKTGKNFSNRNNILSLGKTAQMTRGIQISTAEKHLVKPKSRILPHSAPNHLTKSTDIYRRNENVKKSHEHSARHKCADSSQLLHIQLNVKECCEFKYLENYRLPRYNGYISQYGLSKNQLEVRDRNRRSSMRQQFEKEKQMQVAQQHISDINEQAFRQWLKRKNRGAKTKYKNMYKVNTH